MARVPEMMAAVMGAALLLSLVACIAAEATGWFLAYNGLELGAHVEASTSAGSSNGLNLLAVNVGWDRYSISINGQAGLTTRFLDDVSPAGYTLGVVTFLIHICSALASGAACLWLYYVFMHDGALPKALSKPQRPYLRWLSWAMLGLAGLLLATGVLALPFFVTRDFHRAFAPHLDGGFTVRPSWAFGITILVCLASALVGGLLARRAAALDRCVVGWRVLRGENSYTRRLMTFPQHILTLHKPLDEPLNNTASWPPRRPPPPPPPPTKSSQTGSSHGDVPRCIHRPSPVSAPADFHHQQVEMNTKAQYTRQFCQTD